MTTLDKVKKMIAEQLCISTDDIADDANIVDDLGADSLDVVEMLMTLEDDYGISIPDDRLEEVKSIPNLVKLLEELAK